MPELTRSIKIVWLHAVGCTGCSISTFNSTYPHAPQILLEEILPGIRVEILFHSTLMKAHGSRALKPVREAAAGRFPFLLVVEGAIPVGPQSYLGGIGGGKDLPSLVEDLARHCTATVALGTCAAYGGLAAARPNPGQCRGVWDFLESRGLEAAVINLPGCPPHPDWVVGTLAAVAAGRFDVTRDLDDELRPVMYYGTLVHQWCPRRASFDEGKFAKKLGDPGCLYELGCKGSITYGDCPQRHWNNRVSWCIGVGAPCSGCTQPEFPDWLGGFQEKITDVQLPTIGEYWQQRRERGR